MNGETQDLTGVLPVLCTPFNEDGSIDDGSIRSLVDHQLRWGADGIVVFGLAGELYKLTDEDRRRVLTTVVEKVDGRAPIIVGTEHSGTEGAIARSRLAADCGASALMLYPPTFVKPDAANVVDYFVSVGKAVSLPIIVQDAPQWTGVPLPVEMLTAIARTVPNVGWVKVEAPPAATKIRALCNSGLSVIGGYGVLHLIEDIRAGVQAIMPGCALPGLYKDLWSSHRRNEYDQLWADFTRVLPLLSYQMSSLDTFVTVQKHLLFKAGVLRSATMRRPVTQLGPGFSTWLAELVDRTGVARYLDQPASAGRPATPLGVHHVVQP